MAATEISRHDLQLDKKNESIAETGISTIRTRKNANSKSTKCVETAARKMPRLLVIDGTLLKHL